MAKSGALDLAANVGGKMERSQVKSAVDNYEKYHDGVDEEERKANCTDMANKYYDLATSFYEYGWGESFHFAPRWKGESLQESLKRYEHFIALQLGLKRGQKVLDVGCGIGGPLREIAGFSGASITGLNNNEYQIKRGKELNRVVGLDETCNFVLADFMKMPFPDDTFDAIYATEATGHAPDLRDCYKEIFRVLKPGRCFAAFEWCLTDSFDPMNQEHQSIKADVFAVGVCLTNFGCWKQREIELGNGLPDIRSIEECLEALKFAGFEVIWDKDLAEDSPQPWYLPLDDTQFSLTGFRTTAVGRFITSILVKFLECLGLAPEGSQNVLAFLEKGASGLVKGGRTGIFTPNYFFLVKKPLL